MPRNPQELGAEQLGVARDNETTPLLAASPVAPYSDSAAADALVSGNATEKPLALTQILLLCFTRLVEPLAFFCIVPFVNQMVADNGHLDEADVGFYVGLIESLFSLTQMAVMVAWGRASDRYGRKPVLTFSLAGISVATTFFGFAKTIWQMILLRCVAGVFAGTVVTIRTMIYEHSTPKTQARTFSWFAVTGNLGIFIGPLIAGVLADPAKQYGGRFKNIQFFNVFPYASPTIVTGAIGVAATLISAFFIEETLTPEKRAALNKAESKPSTWELLKAPGVAMVIYLEAHVMLLGFAYTATTPVFWYTSVQKGGFGFSELQISLFMAMNGISQLIWLLLAFPLLHKRFGTGGILRACGYAYPFFIAAVPLAQMLLREGSEAAVIAFWSIAPLALSIGCGVSMSFTAIQLAVNDVNPSSQTLGTLNAIVLAVVSGLRAFAPVVSTSIFAVGVKYQILRGYLVWVAIFFVAAGFTVAVLYLPKNAEGKLPREEEETSGADSG